MSRTPHSKREREYEELKAKFRKAGEYRRENEFSGRIVSKQRSQLAGTRKK